MGTIDANPYRPGTKPTLGGEVYNVSSNAHTSRAKGGAFVQVKLKACWISPFRVDR